jgi:hypothetical protein
MNRGKYAPAVVVSTATNREDIVCDGHPNLNRGLNSARWLATR